MYIIYDLYTIQLLMKLTFYMSTDKLPAQMYVGKLCGNMYERYYVGIVRYFSELFNDVNSHDMYSRDENKGSVYMF